MASDIRSPLAIARITMDNALFLLRSAHLGVEHVAYIYFMP